MHVIVELMNCVVGDSNDFGRFAAKTGASP